METQTKTGQELKPVQLTSLKSELDNELVALDKKSPEGGSEIENQAKSIVDRLLAVDPEDHKAREDARGAVETMSQKLQLQAARKSAMLKEPIHKLSQRSEDGGPVANALVDLKMQVEALDPARFDLSPGWFSRSLGYLPFVGTPIKRYFSKYESSSSVIDAIVKSLENGREQLKRDNITLQDDQAEMRELTKQLMRAVSVGQVVDTELTARLENDIPSTDPRYAFIQEELLFPLRQRIMDLQQQLAVNQQGVLTTEIIIRNNKELIRGVNRATSVTVNALQIAITLALALANQKIVLEKIQAVNKTTDELIANTAAQLRQQGTAIHKQAASAQLSIDTLRKAFEDINGAMEDISKFRREALPTMAQNILELDKLSEQTEESIVRMETARAANVPMEIEVNSQAL